MKHLFSGFAIATGIVAALFSACTTTGPSTEQGNPQIVAIVLDGANRPVQGAAVVVYAAADNADSTQQPSSAAKVAASTTDALGKCAFDSLAPGTYSITATDNDSAHSASATDIVISLTHPPQPEFSDTLVLAAPGSLNGVVTRGGVPGTINNANLRDGFIQVKIGEIDRFTVTGPSGSYSFANIPAGSYTLYYYATDGFYSARRERIIAHPGRDTLIDTVTLSPVPRLIPPTGFKAVYDTVQGIVRLQWHKVNYPDLRWYEAERIDPSGPFDTVFTVTDTTFADSLKSIPAGTTLYYVVRSVDTAFNRSQNAGGVGIITRRP
jgi:hypothetical protein